MRYFISGSLVLFSIAGPHSILWKRGNAVLTARDIKIVLEPRIQLVNGFNLQIRKVRPQDAGDYVCQVSTVDTMEQSHTLEILGKPNLDSVLDSLSYYWV